MAELSGKTIAILATHGFEQSELMEPKRRLEEAGATVRIVSPETGEIRGWRDKDWGATVRVDVPVQEARVEDYDALVIPGGQINPDLLRIDEAAVSFVRDFYNSKKPLAAICHAPWVLIEAGIVKGRIVTSYKSIRTDLINAGANWVDKEVAVDEGLITSRHPGDLEAFSAKIIEEVQEGRHYQRQAA